MKHNDSIMVTYEAPKCTIMDVMPEGVLCQSNPASFNADDLKNGINNWFEEE